MLPSSHKIACFLWNEISEWNCSTEQWQLTPKWKRKKNCAWKTSHSIEFQSVCGIPKDLYDCAHYCWDIHTVWRSFPNDTVLGTGSIISLYCYAFYTSHSWACFSNPFISFHPAPSFVHTQTRYRRFVVVSRFLRLYLHNTCLPWHFSWNTNTKHMLVCDDRFPLTRLYCCGVLLCSSLSAVHAIMRQAPTID